MTQRPLDMMAFGSFPDTRQLYDVSLNTTGIVVMILVGVGMLIWMGLAYLRYRRLKRLEQMPDVLGEPNDLLEQTCNILGLGISERRGLKKSAVAMKLAQPVSILLSPALLIEAARVWKKSHLFTPSQYWGLRRLDEISRKIFDKGLDELDG